MANSPTSLESIRTDMDYISVKDASEKWGMSERRIQKLCEENRIDGTLKFG